MGAAAVECWGSSWNNMLQQSYCCFIFIKQPSQAFCNCLLLQLSVFAAGWCVWVWVKINQCVCSWEWRSMLPSATVWLIDMFLFLDNNGALWHRGIRSGFDTIDCINNGHSSHDVTHRFVDFRFKASSFHFGHCCFVLFGAIRDHIWKRGWPWANARYIRNSC